MRKGALLVLLSALVFAGYVFYSLLGVEPVKVEQSRMVRSGDRILVEGELRNTGEDIGAIDVEVRYFDRSGHSIARDNVAISSLKHGDTAKFRSVPRRLEGAAEFSIYLNHGRNPYGN
ncbi:MAG: FxLYD domain-containing protein [Candidatus Binatus sp.]|uniref:FxLYD domain-containing protein n=1 Tax=Candidatus Binatus sp. TaxID=2811406 RepID=UPI0027271605|nr:FxLYD domain-containing protein [Candidatus Binatus sp.]MDO8433377.1 FxLYD domain-containing protein [Candidatus Binatus sp.]